MTYKGSNPFIKEIPLSEWLDTKGKKVHTLISRHIEPDTNLDSINPGTRKVLKQIRKDIMGDYLTRFYDSSKNGTENYRSAEFIFLSFISTGQEEGIFPMELKALMASDKFVGINSDMDKSREANATRNKYT